MHRSPQHHSLHHTIPIFNPDIQVLDFGEGVEKAVAPEWAPMSSAGNSESRVVRASESRTPRNEAS